MSSGIASESCSDVDSLGAAVSGPWRDAVVQLWASGFFMSAVMGAATSSRKSKTKEALHQADQGGVQPTHRRSEGSALSWLLVTLSGVSGFVYRR